MEASKIDTASTPFLKKKKNLKEFLAKFGDGKRNGIHPTLTLSTIRMKRSTTWTIVYSGMDLLRKAWGYIPPPKFQIFLEVYRYIYFYYFIKFDPILK